MLSALYWFLLGFFFGPEDASEVSLLFKDAVSSAAVSYHRIIGEDHRWRFELKGEEMKWLWLVLRHCARIRLE
jgi:hypothetical protein